MKILINSLISLLLIIASVSSQDTDIEESSTGLYQIEGKIFPPEILSNSKWTQETEVN